MRRWKSGLFNVPVGQVRGVEGVGLCVGCVCVWQMRVGVVFKVCLSMCRPEVEARRLHLQGSRDRFG